MAKAILDISHHEKVTDWTKLKDSVYFLAFKATEGTTFLDPNCYATIAKCEKYGVPYWLYCFLKKGNELTQAKYMVEKTKGEVGKYFVGYCIDCERGNSASAVQNALDYIKKHSKKTMIYTAHHYYHLYKSMLPKRGENCAWWEPRYGGNKPHDGVDLWQYSESYKCSYIDGLVDANKIYGKKPLSWFTTPTVAKEKETNTTTAKKVVTNNTTTKTAKTTPDDKVIKVAEAEVGYLEKKSNKDLDNKTANAGSANYTKYGKWLGMNGDYWCASFVSWCFYKAYGNDLGKKLLCGSYSAACEVIRQNFIKKKQYHTFLTGAKPGDVIFFKGSRHSGANHIGIIYKVADGKVYTIEGNTSGASGVVDNGGGVAKKSYKTSDTHVLGYGRPDYDAILGKSTVTGNTADKTTTVKGTSYYPKCKSTFSSISDALKSVGVKDVSLRARQKIAERNGITNYTGSALQNIKLLELLKAGKLKK